MGGWIDDDHQAFEAAVRHRLQDVAHLTRVQIVINDERGTIVVDHAPARADSCTCTDPAERARHRRRAKVRAAKCLTCRPGPSGYGHGKEGISACLGCGTLIGYFSCAPGYCVLCAHDPCWVKVS